MPFKFTDCVNNLRRKVEQKYRTSKTIKKGVYYLV